MNILHRDKSNVFSRITFAGIQEHKVKLVVSLILIAVISGIHYLTDPHAIAYHNVARRLYYIPIVVSAFALGVRGGIAAAIVVTAMYFPHAFLLEHHHDPAPRIDKILELILYFIVGTVTGFLVEKERRVRINLEKASQKRDELQAQLIQAGKMTALGELSSGLAHEIRNPLASILGSAEALSSEFDADHKKRRIADLLIGEIGRLNNVVSRFLSFAKPGKPQREQLNVQSLLEHTLQIVPNSDLCSIEDCAVEYYIMADENLIHQVLLNLTLNGLASGDKARVYFTTSEKLIHGMRYICISVIDNGGGVDDGVAETLFDPFVTTRIEGSGLGLSISSQIMDAHGGFIDFESARDGSNFHLYFPMEDH